MYQKKEQKRKYMKKEITLNINNFFLKSDKKTISDKLESSLKIENLLPIIKKIV